MTRLACDVGILAVAAGSYYYKWDEGKTTWGAVSLGIQGTAMAIIVEHIARWVFLRTVQYGTVGWSIQDSIKHAVLGEVIYTGILQTQSKWLMPLRFVVTVLIGRTATEHAVKVNRNALFLWKVAVMWGIVREIVVQAAPQSCSDYLLTAGDSIACAYCGKPPKGIMAQNKQWYTALIFRVIANFVASRHGLRASITQHMLYNLSRRLG